MNKSFFLGGIVWLLLLSGICFTEAQAKKFHVKIRNEFGESLQLNLKRSDSESSEQEVYLNAYQTLNLGEMPEGNYIAAVYNLQNDFLGFIQQDVDNRKKSTISINRFKLAKRLKNMDSSEAGLKIDQQKSQDSKEESKPVKTEILKAGQPEKKLQSKADEPLAQQLVEDSISLPGSAEDEVSQPASSPKPISGLQEQSLELESLPKPKDFGALDSSNPNLISQTLDLSSSTEILSKKKIKVANISSGSVHIDIIEPGKNPIGKGWSIPNDIYVPQFLLLESEPVVISSDADLIIRNEAGSVTKKQASELKVDEQGSFIWVIKD